MHREIEPKILYLGTPVVLISTLNEDGSPNLAPMSSAWWLKKSCMLGLGTRGKTFENLQRERECVLNLPSSEMVSAVDRLALTTGKDPMPDYKVEWAFNMCGISSGVPGLSLLKRRSSARHGLPNARCSWKRWSKTYIISAVRTVALHR